MYSGRLSYWRFPTNENIQDRDPYIFLAGLLQSSPSMIVRPQEAGAAL
jgi:hypothetical protein